MQNPLVYKIMHEKWFLQYCVTDISKGKPVHQIKLFFTNNAMFNYINQICFSVAYRVVAVDIHI